MKGLPFIDVDYCMFSDWGYQKPTRIWGSSNLTKLGDQTCNGYCGNMEWTPAGKWVHKSTLGCTAPPGKVKPTESEQYRVPARLVGFLLEAAPHLVPPPRVQESESVRPAATSNPASPTSPATDTSAKAMAPPRRRSPSPRSGLTPESKEDMEKVGDGSQLGVKPRPPWTPGPMEVRAPLRHEGTVEPNVDVASSRIATAVQGSSMALDEAAAS